MHYKAFTYHFDRYPINIFMDIEEKIFFCEADILDIFGGACNPSIINSKNIFSFKDIIPDNVLIPVTWVPETVFLNHQGFLQLILSINDTNMNKVDFIKWIFEDILPDIKKKYLSDPHCTNCTK